MVRSKEVPKKPKDPLLTPPSKPRGFSIRDDGGFGGSLPRNRGGAAMSSPAPASVPNYMRATNSSGAKSGQRQRAGAPSSASASPARHRRPAHVLTKGKVLFPEPAATASPGMVRPTCSSTLKETKFPSALDLAPGSTDAEGPAAMRVCPYNYCSLNGHTHSPAVPLRSFLATRRRLIKTQQSMKHKGVSAFRKGTAHQSSEDKIVCAGGGVAKAAPPLVDEEALGDFFVEVYTGPRVSSGTSCSDMSLDEMDATVRRMEFVVFDRCGADDDSEKGNDLGVSGDGEGRPEDRPAVCRDSSSECSDAGISGNLVEELPWMSYQGYECDSLDNDVSEEQGQIHEEIGEAKVLAQGQEGKDEEGTSGGLGDERKEVADEQQKPEDQMTISDLSSEMGIILEEEGFGCRVDTMHQQEASAGQETQHPGDDEECSSDVAHKMEIAAEQACNVCTVEICKDQGEKDEDTILDKVCQGDNSDRQSTSEITEYEVAGRVENAIEDHEAKDDETNMDSVGQLEIPEKHKDGESEMEIPETVPDVACKEDFIEQEATSRAVSEGELAERVENIIEDSSKEENSADHEAKDDETNMASGGQLEITEKQKESESEKEFSETVPDVACQQDFFEQEAISEAVLVGEISAFDAIDSADVEISNQPTNGCFEQDVNTVEDASQQYGGTMNNSFEQLDTTPENAVNGTKDAQRGLDIDVNTVEDASEQYGGTMNNSFEQLDTTPENTVSGTKDAQRGLDITTCKSEDASEESDITQESSQDFNSACVDAPAQMEQEIAECKPEVSSEESGIPQESSQSDKPAHVNNDAQIEVCVDAHAKMEPEITECNLEGSSEESGIPQESSQSDKSAHVNNSAEAELEFTACKSEDPSEESGITQEIVHDDDSACLGEGAQMQFGNVTSDLEETSEESGIAQEIGEDDNSSYDAQMQLGNVSSDMEETSEESGTAQEIGEDDNSAFDAQNDSEVTTCELADQDYSCSDLSGGAQNESELTPSELANAADLSGGAQNESELTPSELANASEASDVMQEAVSDDNTADVNDGPQKDSEIIACESEHAQEEVDIITQEGNEDDYAASALKETQITTCGTKDASKEVCITEEANLMSIVQTPQHNSDLSATDAHGEPQNLPAEDNDAKEFSVDDMCNVFSSMNLKGDVYVDPTESEISPRKRLIIAGRRRTAEEEEYMRGFNPRAPNFLPLELDLDSEKVDLKHQTAEDRKNAEEWMIDYALRRAVNNLGARKKKVELLVQAFETVLPHEEDDKKNITPTRPAQACN
ncbi:unnamed protein product [Alopecurus aequalis]